MIKQVKYSIEIDIENGNNKRFRYYYKKTWDNTKPIITAILLNPSKADLTFNDNTLDRLTTEFLNREYGGMVILNLFCLMDKFPNKLIYSEINKEIKNLRYIYNYINNNQKKDYFIGWSNSFNNIESDEIKESARKKKKFIEDLFRKNNMKNQVYCYRYNGRKALHPSKYKIIWQYDKYFLR